MCPCRIGPVVTYGSPHRGADNDGLSEESLARFKVRVESNWLVSLDDLINLFANAPDAKDAKFT